MFSKSDYDKLKEIMDESPEKKELLTRLLDSHQMTLSMVSHEIRNPLTLVYSTLQLMESRYPNVLDIPYWSNLRHDIEYMKLLLEELSSYNNGERLSLSSIDLNTFFKALALSFASSLIDTDIQFVSYIEAALPPFYGDALKLKEVFLNLLKNARDAVENSSVSPAIHLSVTHTNSSHKVTSDNLISGYTSAILIVIEDNGCGIDASKLSTIFDPFVTYKKNGTGLGLALSQRIIHAHNGHINATSVPGISTTFTVSLPIQQHT